MISGIVPGIVNKADKTITILFENGNQYELRSIIEGMSGSDL